MSRALSPGVSASNNALKTDCLNPQTLLAFSGLNIAREAPPHAGSNERGGSLDPGAELWYRVIENIDPEFKRAKCYKIDVVDSDGDGTAEIRATLTDGRFYYLDKQGTELRVDLGDQFLREFPDTAPPPLTELPLR